MMYEELVELLSQIQESIRRGEIEGYKNLLYLISQVNRLEDNRDTTEMINNFIEIMFREGLITEGSMNSMNSGNNNMSNNMMLNGNNNGKNNNNCCDMPQGNNMGGNSGEPLDLQVMGVFRGIIPIPIRNTVERNIRNRFRF